MVVVADSCGLNNTFAIHGGESVFLGKGDLHDAKYNSMEISAHFVEFESGHLAPEHCHHKLHIFPMDSLKSEHMTNRPIFLCAGIIALFLCSGIMFLIYDWLVSNRQTNTEQKARKANTIVRGLFPADVASQLYDDKQEGAGGPSSLRMGNGPLTNTGATATGSNTIAQLYPAATVLCESRRANHNGCTSTIAQALTHFCPVSCSRGYLWLHRLEFHEGTAPSLHVA
jgi:hypothetical protein